MGVEWDVMEVAVSHWAGVGAELGLYEGLTWTWRTDDCNDEKSWEIRLGIGKRNGDLWDGRSVKFKKKGQELSHSWKRMGRTQNGRWVNWAFYVSRMNRELIARGCGSPMSTKARGCPFGMQEGRAGIGDLRTLLWSL